uniref:non-specific serine/threonine protein kinase n=1 Tax=Kalanchoe fedtschenkoi TaxID=63787 RepID=A0A7N0V9X2_KALFE
MKSPGYAYGGRQPRRSYESAQSPARSTHYSTTSPYSEASVTRRNPLVDAARSLVGAIGSCFLPPDATSKISRPLTDSDESATSSQPVTERRYGMNQRANERGRTGLYSTENSSAHRKEPGSVKFTMEEILKATKNFNTAFKIGQGGFGTVYKGRLDDGSLVAIKRAKKIMYDKHLGAEFQSEIRTLAQIEHMNLVRCLGYLEHGDERLIVVEYVPNGTLRDHLDGLQGAILNLAARLDILIDVAHAITYLHMYTDHPIIHRDIKSSNILLTENLRAKVADFGFARLAPDSDSGATHVSTQVKGTAGYLDPEYLRTYQLTDKSDVYSFGVLLVEVVTGRRPIEPKRELKERITARWAIKKFTDGTAISTLDPRLEPSAANSQAVEKILELALQCLASHRHNRPTMKRCVEILWSIRKDYKEISGSDTPSYSDSRKTSVREYS